MNYERLLRKLRRDDRLFDESAEHKINRVLLAVKARVLDTQRLQRLQHAAGPYSGLTRAELRRTGTCEPDWY